MRSSPFNTPKAPLREPSEIRRRGYLKGTQPLWKAFWLFFFLGALGTYVALWVGLYFTGYALIGVVMRWNELLVWRAYRELHALAAIIPQFAYACLSVVVVWRCSKDASSLIWRSLARFVVCIPVLILALFGGYCLWLIALRT